MKDEHFIKGIYQSKEYLVALNATGEKIIDVSDGFFCIERAINLPGFGRKKILEGRGNPNEKDIRLLKERAKKYFYVTIMPCVVSSKLESFEKEKYRKTANHTILIDLKKTEDELWKALDKGSIRWGVNYAKKSGLIFEKSNKIDEFYELYLNTAKEGGFTPESKEFISSLISSDVAKLFLINKDKKVVAGGMILIDKENNYSILDLTSSSEEGMKLQAMPFLYWNFILYSKSLGLSYFDIGGYDNEAREGEKTWNINKFKNR